jgi:hypothetical protein
MTVITLTETDGGVCESLAPTTGASTAKGLSGARPPIDVPSVDRSEADDMRVCYHEVSHATVGRMQGQAIGGVTCVAGADFGGLCWGPAYVHGAKLPDSRSTPTLFEKLRAVMPEIGESRAGVADIFLHVHNQVVELVAGTEGERLFCEGEPWFAADDERQAFGYASLITSSPASAAAFIEFARVEAISLLTSSAYIVRALANELRIKRTMDGSEIDAIIERAVGANAIELEHQRRDEWRRREISAAAFKTDSSLRNN